MVNHPRHRGYDVSGCQKACASTDSLSVTLGGTTTAVPWGGWVAPGFSPKKRRSNDGDTVHGPAKSEPRVENGGLFIPLFIGFQHVSTILLVVYRISQPSTVWQLKQDFYRSILDG